MLIFLKIKAKMYNESDIKKNEWGNVMKRQFGWLGIIIGIVLLLGGCQARVTTKKKVSHINGAYVPTLFFHGYGSSINAETHMANAAVRAGVTRTVVQAVVADDGQVQLKGTFKPRDDNPIVEVGFTNNQNTNYRQSGQWVKNVITALQRRYHIKAINVVGHSMGNMAIADYLLQYGQDKDLPPVKKQVDIAGHFNGILGMDDKPNQVTFKQNGQPTKMNRSYRQLLKLRQRYPKGQIDVLNIYGDKDDGTHSDGRVSNASSQSLRYLIEARAKSYREKRIVGADAQHSKLHENAQVDQALIKFIWHK